jgi:hypothetical protein
MPKVDGSVALGRMYYIPLVYTEILSSDTNVGNITGLDERTCVVRERTRVVYEDAA